MKRYVCAMVVLYLAVCEGRQAGVAKAPRPTCRRSSNRLWRFRLDLRCRARSSEGRRAQLIRQLIADHFLRRRWRAPTIKESWETLSQTQRHEFETLFIDLFQDSYTRMVLNYLHRETVTYQNEQPEGSGRRVWTSIMRVNEHIPVEYALVHKDGQW